MGFYVIHRSWLYTSNLVNYIHAQWFVGVSAQHVHRWQTRGAVNLWNIPLAPLPTLSCFGILQARQYRSGAARRTRRITRSSEGPSSSSSTRGVLEPDFLHWILVWGYGNKIKYTTQLDTHTHTQWHTHTHTQHTSHTHTTHTHTTHTQHTHTHTHSSCPLIGNFSGIFCPRVLWWWSHDPVQWGWA